MSSKKNKSNKATEIVNTSLNANTTTTSTSESASTLTSTPTTTPTSTPTTNTINNLHNPYINTSLTSYVMLMPNQMDNKLYLHLKSNLINNLEGKCYKNYGFVNKIFSVTEITDGKIDTEDASCSATFMIKFTCNICFPIVGKEIICKIDRMNKTLISAVNGPIRVIITADKINSDNFFPDINRNIRIRNSITSEFVIPDMYIKILVLSKSFSDKDTYIIVIGLMQNVASQDEINEYMNHRNSTNDDVINDDFF